jgi:CheY-like chemotaxis protein
VARILVVDDDPAIRSVVRRALALDGHDIGEAGTGREALAVFQAAPVDVVVTDLYMPDMDGLEFTRALLREYVGTKVIAMSGGAVQQPADALAVARQLGAVATLAKPFSVADLRAVVRRALGDPGSG